MLWPQNTLFVSPKWYEKALKAFQKRSVHYDYMVPNDFIYYWTKKNEIRWLSMINGNLFTTGDEFPLSRFLRSTNVRI